MPKDMQLCEKFNVELLEAEEDFLPPTPIPKIDLHDAHAIRREMASVYRDMRAKNIEPQEGTRLVYVLDMLRKAYETSVLQERLEAVERVLNRRNGD